MIWINCRRLNEGFSIWAFRQPPNVRVSNRFVDFRTKSSTSLWLKREKKEITIQHNDVGIINNSKEKHRESICQLLIGYEQSSFTLDWGPEGTSKTRRWNLWRDCRQKAQNLKKETSEEMVIYRELHLWTEIYSALSWKLAQNNVNVIVVKRAISWPSWRNI